MLIRVSACIALLGSAAAVAQQAPVPSLGDDIAHRHSRQAGDRIGTDATFFPGREPSRNAVPDDRQVCR